MATTDKSNTGALLKELYALPPVRVLRDKSYLHDKLVKEVAELDFAGKYVRWPVTIQRNLGRGSRGDAGILPVAGTEVVKDATVFMKQHYQALEWSEAIEVASKNKAGAFENIVTLKMKTVAIDMAKEANRQHYNGATGSFATLTTNAAASAALVVDTAQYFQVGDIIDIFSAGVIVAAGTGVSVLSINKATKTVTVSAAQTLTAANVVTFHLGGNFGNECEGLRVICAKDRILHGIDSSVAGQDEWSGNVRPLASAVAGEASFELLKDDVGERQREGLFAEHRLAGTQRCDRPACMQAGRQRVINRVDVGLGDQRGVIFGDVRDAMRRGIIARAVRIARGDRDDSVAGIECLTNEIAFNAREFGGEVDPCEDRARGDGRCAKRAGRARQQGSDFFLAQRLAGVKDCRALDEVAQMMGGLAYMTGPPGQPLRAGASVIDVTGGLFGVIGILAALEERRRTGRGGMVTAALFETTVYLVGQHMAQFAVTGAPATASATSRAARCATGLAI